MAYVFANRFLNILPTALSFLTSVPSTLYEALWGVAKEALQHALRLGDASLVRKPSSTDSPGEILKFYTGNSSLSNILVICNGF